MHGGSGIFPRARCPALSLRRTEAPRTALTRLFHRLDHAVGVAMAAINNVHLARFDIFEQEKRVIEQIHLKDQIGK